MDGSLAFVDISGFTSMTERLARKGKVGAEEMNDVLDALFTELLAVAYDDGAGLVKWGGDAVLLLFDGEDHAPRACRAALNMQRTIKRVGKITTSVGQVRLRMSVGIHSGPFDFFLVGDPEIHRELVIVGPSSTRTVLMEQTAEATEVAVSPETAALIPADAVGEPKEEALLLRARSEVPFRPARPGPDIRGIDLEQLVPVAIREYLLTEETQPEHRRITAGFLEFAGTDDFLASRGPAETAAALDACVRTVQRAALQHGVGFFETDVAKNAFRVMLIVGAPSSGGGDEDRMLGTLRAVAETELPIPMRAGTNGGHVFSGYFGPQFRKTYSVKGDAVNTAARVMAKAEPGQILATASVLDAASSLHEVEAIEPFAAKGKRNLVHAWSVGRRVGTRGEETRLPLVGREAEVATLRSALDDARGGSGRAIEISGPAGIGKTRVLEELVTAADGFRVLRAICEPYQQGIAYRPFRAIVRTILDVPKMASPIEAVEALSTLVDSLAPDLVPWLPLLAVVLDAEVPVTPEVASLDERFRRERLEELVVRLLTVSLPEPTLVMLEDVHWIDEPSAGVLGRAARDAAGHSWVIATTRRDGAGVPLADASPGVITVELAPLVQDDAVRAIQLATEDAPLRPDEIAVLTDRSGGNPLFLKELLWAWRSRGRAGELPLSVESAVTADIDRLPVGERKLLRAAAVLGSSFNDEVLSAVLQQEVERASIARLEAFLEPEGESSWRFRHALMRDAAYEGLPYRLRRDLHARAGTAILERAAGQTEQASELLSLHFYEAQRYPDAWGFSRMAGERAFSKYANHEAATFFARAIEAGRRAGLPPAEVAAAWESLGDVHWRVGAYRDADRAFATSRRLREGDRVAQANLIHKQARIPYKGGRFPLSIRRITKGLALLDGLHDEEATRQRAQLIALRAGVRAAEGRYRLAIEDCESIGSIAKQLPDDVLVLDALGRAYYILDFCHVEQGRLELATNWRRAAEIFERLRQLGSEADVMVNGGTYLYYAGHWDEAVELWERASELRMKMGDAVEAALGTNNIGEVRSDQGRLSEAEELFRDALRVNRAAASPEGIAFALSNLGRAASRAGRFDEAMDLLDEARRTFEEIGDKSQALEAEARIAEAMVFAGEAAAARARVEETLKKAIAVDGVAIQEPMLHRIDGLALAAQGQVEESRAALEESLRVARARDAAYDVALTLDAIVRVAELTGTDVPEAAAESREILARLGVVELPTVPLSPRVTSSGRP